MLGSRFDLSKVLSNRLAPAKPVEEAPCLELERELAAVAETVHLAVTRESVRCPVCDEVMRVHDECALSEFGALDVKLHRFECDACGMSTGRVYHPAVGYHARLVR